MSACCSSNRQGTGREIVCPDRHDESYADVNEAVEAMRRKGYRTANTGSIYHAIAKGIKAYGRYWDWRRD